MLSDPVCEPGKICVSWNGEGEGMGTCKPRCLTNSDCMENEICETTGPDLPCFIGNCACLGSSRNSGKSFIDYYYFELSLFMELDWFYSRLLNTYTAN